MSCGLILIVAISSPRSGSRPDHLVTDLILALALTFLVFLHLVVATFVYETDWARSAVVLLALALMLFIVPIVSRMIFSSGSAGLVHAMRLNAAAFILIVIPAWLGLQPAAPLASSKPIFPFTEPSHFALSFAPIFVFAGVRARLRYKAIWIAAGLLIAIILQSFSMVFAVFVGALISLPIRQLLVSGVAVFAASQFVDLQHFQDRLDLSDNTRNLSSLVYSQGWEIARESLQRSWGWGIGFMQQGYIPTNVSTANLINLLVGSDINLKDGGFTAAKLISEFGALGVMMVIVFVYVAIIAAIQLRRSSAKGADDVAMVAALSMICGYSVELLVRGVGFFSGTTILCLAAGLYLWRRDALFWFADSHTIAPKRIDRVSGLHA